MVCRGHRSVYGGRIQASVLKKFLRLCGQTQARWVRTQRTDREPETEWHLQQDDTSTPPPTPARPHFLSACRVPRTSSMHAECHSRRMTSFSSTMPFPLLTLNCHTPPSFLPSQPAGLYWFLERIEIHTRDHTQTRAHAYSYMHAPSSLPFCDLHSVGNCVTVPIISLADPRAFSPRLLSSTEFIL